MSHSIQPPAMQPTFRKEVAVGPEELMQRIRQRIKNPDLRGLVASAGYCVDLHIPPDQQRFWSPHLNVHISSRPGGSELLGRFSPRPEIWTMFMAIYFVAAFFVFVAAIYGYVQWFLGEVPWALVVIPILALVIALLHIASLAGQRLSSDQMAMLRDRFDALLSSALQDS